jgi:hypothetical protein
MRHGDVRLTLQTYDDSDFAEMEDAVKALRSWRSWGVAVIRLPPCLRAPVEYRLLSP